MTKIRRFYKNELFHEILFLSLAFLCMMIFVFLQPFGEGPDEIDVYKRQPLYSRICSAERSDT